MLRFFSAPSIGLEITSRAMKLGALTTNGGPMGKPMTQEISLPAGMVGDAYASPNIKEKDGLTSLLREAMQGFSPLRTRRLGLGLADTVFRVQTLEFDELPGKTADRDRLVRWRVEKGAAFDATNTVLRYQVLPRQGRGFSVLACLAKRDVLSQYEDLIEGLGYETWAVGPASFHALNFHAPSLTARGVQGFAFAWVTDSSYAVLVTERGLPRFYRCKEIRQGTADATDRVVRELEDSLHFYTHLDRQQSSEIDHLFLAGDTPMLSPLAEALRAVLTLEINVLAVHDALPAAGGVPDAFSSVLGAGGAV